jgi:glycosyltransferase involved in cell wall biosynthesis
VRQPHGVTPGSARNAGAPVAMPAQAWVRPGRVLLHCVPNMAGGGAERQLALLAAGQVAHGDEVHVALGGGGPNLERLRSSGARLHLLRTAGSHDPRLWWRLVRVARSVRPSVIQTWLTQMDVAGGLAALTTGTAWVIAERASGLAYRDRWKDRRLRVRLGRRADAVVANSAAGRAYWMAAGHPATAVVPNILPLAEIEAVQAASDEEAGVGPGAPLILFAGRLAPQKNIPFLLDVLAVLMRDTDAVALLCGDGPERAAIAARIGAAGFGDRIRLAGYRDDLWALMKRATVFVNPSRFEGLPNTVLEAMAAGTPVVASDIPEHRDFPPDALALLPLDDPAAWVRGLRDALAGSQPVRVRVAAARDYVAGLSSETAVAAYEAVYAQALARRGVGA